MIDFNIINDVIIRYYLFLDELKYGVYNIVFDVF